jgi:hypothetical protein
MILRPLLTAILGLGLSSCASFAAGQGPGGGQQVYSPDAFAHRVATAHLTLYWNCSRPEANLLRLEGVAQNPWSSQPVGFVALDLVGVSGEGRVLSQTKGEVRDIMLYTNQVSPFDLALRTVGSEVRFDLHYRYQFEDAEMEARLAGPFMPGLRLATANIRFLARDVCSETQHRAR